MGFQTWLTSAMTEKDVNKAIVLAGSLRRVKTAIKLAVLTTTNVPKESREALTKKFDSVILLDKESPFVLSPEEYAKMEGFSLVLFKKIVYLSPNVLVLKNCDEIFKKYDCLAVSTDIEVNSSVYLFTPSLNDHATLREFADKSEGNWLKSFNEWLGYKGSKLGEEFNVTLSLSENNLNCVNTCVFIVNFADVHPLDIPEQFSGSNESNFGTVEMFAGKYFWEIFNQDVKLSSINPGMQILRDEGSEHEPVAIVGLSFRLPGGNTVDEFWDVLKNGKDAIQKLPSFRWRRDQIWVHSSHHKNRNVEAGFLNCPIDEFDAKFFGISPKEAVFLDPQQRLLHEVTWEALEDAGIDPLKLYGTQTGFFVGSWTNDYKDIATRTTDVDFFRVYMGNSIAAEAARLSHFLGTTGPSIATESGCSSSIVAVDLACKSLRHHESNLAIACGVNLLINPFDSKGFSIVIAPDGRCKTFDANANGFGRAEACTVLVLKRLADAVRDGDNIWGLIRGSAVTQEGVSKSLGTPTVHCEALAMELALKDAGVYPEDVSFIETHGTGTPVGDPLEFAAISKAYTTKARNSPLMIGSVKTNVGHTESASGITGIIKVLLAMKHDMIPPHRNLNTLNPAIDLSIIPAQIPLSPVAWPKQLGKPRIAGVSSFGISGTDGHAIVEEPPLINPPQINFQVDRPLHIMKISAKSQESFDSFVQKYLTLLEQESTSDKDNEFGNIAYSANTGRSTFNFRAVIIAENCTQAAKILEEKTFKHKDVQGTGAKLCFLFTGQGSQYKNMASSLYNASPIFKLHFDRCDHILHKQYNVSIKDVLWGDASKDDGQLNRTLFSQTSIFCVEYCLLMMWDSWGVKPDYVLGHSLGEFCAAVAAGALTFEDALMLVAERSQLIDVLPRGKMLVIRADKKTVDELVVNYKINNPTFWVDYAAINSPEQTVVAGDSKMIEEFAQYCKCKSVKSIVLASTHAFHSRHMDPMLYAYRKVSSTVKTPNTRPNAPQYISGMDGKLIETSEINSEYWVRHTREKVSFLEACKVAESEGCNLFLEVGPHPVLSALAMMNINSSVTCLPSIRRQENEWVTILESLGKLYLSEWKGDINWKGFDHCYIRHRVPLPFYPFNRKPVWAPLRPVPGELHPLIGKLIPSAASQTIYEQELTVKKAEFVQDHVIGNTIIFPGAGFLEMCLSAGHSTVQCLTEDLQMPRRPISIKGLKIMCPLALYDSELCVLQTVVTLTEDEGNELSYSVEVHRSSNNDQTGGATWITQASATFLPVTSSQLKECSCNIDIHMMQTSWPVSTDAQELYDKLPEVGLRFGPKFQSLESAWRGDDGILLQVKVPSDTSSYIFHPVVGDAMVQACMLWSSRGNMKRKLQVPVHIGEFIWLADSADTQRYIYSSTKEGVTYALLVDSKGLPLAYMGSVDFAETTAKLVESMIRQQSTALPQLWHETYKFSPGKLQRRMEFSNGDNYIYQSITPELKATADKLNEISSEEMIFHKDIETRIAWYFLNALYQLGWKPQIGDVFSIEQLMSELSIENRNKQFVTFFCQQLAGQGFFDTIGKHKYEFVSAPPAQDTISSNLECITNPSYKGKIAYQLVTEVGSNLQKVLSGELDPLQLLFTDDPTKPDAGKFYAELREWCLDVTKIHITSCVLPIPIRMVDEWKKNPVMETKPIFRMLEVGAGTGVASKEFMTWFEEHGIPYEYYYTDVSAAFFSEAENYLKDHETHIIFKKLNIEEDPLHQGFCPEYFDYIFAVEVLHVAKDVKKMLQNLRSLLRPNGVLNFSETIVPDSRITFFFGLLEGYWQFEDFDLRPDHITLTPSKWNDVLRSAKFSHVEYLPIYMGVHGSFLAVATPSEEATLKVANGPKYPWLVLGDDTETTERLVKELERVNRQVDVIKKSQVCFEEKSWKILLTERMGSYKETPLEGIVYLWGLPQDNDRDQCHVSLPFVTLGQIVSNMEKCQPKVFVVTQGLYEVHGSEVVNPVPGTLTGIIRALENENPHLHLSQIDVAPDKPVSNQIHDIFYAVWGDKCETVALRNGKRYLPTLELLNISDDYLQIPNGCDRFKLQLPSTRQISDLEFVYLDSYSLGDDEVEIQVKAIALNFRDVFTVIKPIPLFESFNSVGLDLAGVVTRVGNKVKHRKVGDRVYALNTSDHLALPSHVKLGEKFALLMPDNYTFMEGASMPAVFLTCVLCLRQIAKMEKGETVTVLGSRMTLTAAQLKDCNTPQLLAQRLVDILEGKDEESEVMPTMDELKLLIREDSILPSNIAPEPGIVAKDIGSIEYVLLTGVTGNLGPYLLRELITQSPNIRKIYCLIRKSGKLSGEERLKQILITCQIMNDVDMSKVECIQGDLTEPRFGLSEDQYESLAKNIDCIIHSAVRSDHVAKYWKAPETNKVNIRTVNVIGTNRILEFAAYKTLKHVYHASTLLSVTDVDEDGCVLENWQHVGAFDVSTHNFGYPISKHIAEQLVKQGIERGIPCKVIRLPLISGDSRDGRCDFKRSHALLQWLAFMKLGCMPDLPMPIPLISVDHCAELSVQLFLDSRTSYDVYNITENNPILEQQIIQVAKEHFNITIEPVPYQVFIDRLKEEDENSPLANFKKVYEAEDVIDMANSPAFVLIQKYFANSENFFRCTKTSKIISNYQEQLEPGDMVMVRDLKYLQRSGIFQKFGII